jgi:hypothetical protein
MRKDEIQMVAFDPHDVYGMSYRMRFGISYIGNIVGRYGGDAICSDEDGCDDDVEYDDEKLLECIVCMKNIQKRDKIHILPYFVSTSFMLCV